MLDKHPHDPLASKLQGLPHFDDFLQELKSDLSANDTRIFGQGAERRIAEGLTCLAVFASEPFSFAFDAFEAVCPDDLSEDQKAKLMEIALAKGLVTKDPKTGRYKVTSAVNLILTKYLNEEGL